ncbi:MAG: branched-chain amino acid ABC transporter substrate-binding protein, partial [Chloroflexota bacterium]|nr:branched-chain amino acid ABC transporter substrate-binding protein [Chloroflexota bacterium]
MKAKVLFLMLVVAALAVFVASCAAPTTAPTVPTTAPVAPTAAPAKFTCTDKIGCVDIKPNDPVHIAFWGVLSTADAPLGTDSKYGVEIAIDDKGNNILGHKIQLTTEDGQCTPEGGATAATKLAVDTTIVALVGSSCSDETVGGIATLTKAGLTTISPSNTRPVLTDPKRGPDYAGYLRTAHSDSFQGKTVAEFAFNVLKVKNAATIHDGSSYAQALQQVFVDNFKALGGNVVAQEAVKKGDTDMHAVLTKVATSKPDFL